MREDIEYIVKKYKIPTLGLKKEYKNIENYLSNDEKVLFVYPGNASIVKCSADLKADPLNLKNKKPGIFVITNKKVFHFNRILGESYEQIPISEVSSYRIEKTAFVGGVIQIISNNYIIEVDLSYKKEIVSAARNAMEKALENKNNMQIENDNLQVDIPEQIKKLADLKDQGILTEQEFIKKKTELLAKM